MYAKYYQLQSDPFRLTPDPDFSFAHQSYGKAWAYMQYALRQGEGFLVITGRPGSGKTTLIRSLLAELEKRRIASAVLVSTRFDAADLVPMVAHAFGLQVDDTDKVTILKRLEEFLVRHSRGGHPALLLIDEAQGLSSGTLQELYRLTNLYEGDTPLLQVFLVGQEQLRGVLHAAGWGELRQRLIAACNLEPLNLEQTHAYIRHRLLRSGWRGNPQLSDEAVRLIHRYSEGLPRRINTMCSRLLLFGSVHDKRALDGDDVRLVVDELREERLHVDEQGEDEAAIAEQAEYAEHAGPGVDEVPAEAAPAPRPATDIEKMDTGTFDLGIDFDDVEPPPAPPLDRPEPARPEPPPRPERRAAAERPRAWDDDDVDLHMPGPRRYQPEAEPRTPPPPADEPRERRRGGGRLVVLLIFGLGMLVLFRNFLPIPMNDGAPEPETPAATTAAPEPREPQSTAAQQPAAGTPERQAQPQAMASTPATAADTTGNTAPATPREPPDAAVLNQGTDAGEAAPAGKAATQAPAQAPAAQRPASDGDQAKPESPAADTSAGAESAPTPAGETPVAAHAPRPTPESTGATNTAPRPTPDTVGSTPTDQRVQDLLAQAKAALDDYQLTIPEEHNAYSLYQQVLQLDPDNAAAKQGLQDVVQHYVWLARSSLEQGDYQRVEQYAQRGARLDPDNEQLRAIERLLTIERERRGLNR